MADVPLFWHPPTDSFLLPSNEVHVWRAFVDVKPARDELFLDLLTPDERERAGRFHLLIHRQRFIATRGILRTLLARYLNATPQELRFRYGPHGKPDLTGELADAGLRFNQAHSDGLVLFALTRNREIGVDVERMHRSTMNGEVAQRIFSPKEVAVLEALPADLQSEGFYNCWTRKEAYLKARGRGLIRPLDDFIVSLVPDEPARLLATIPDPQEAARWTLQELAPGIGFNAALAVEGAGWRLSCWEWPSNWVL